jgi:hypothetical protein
LSKLSASESPQIIAEAAENHASPQLQRPTESEVNAAGITQNERNRRQELQSIRKRLPK